MEELSPPPSAAAAFESLRSSVDRNMNPRFAVLTAVMALLVPADVLAKGLSADDLGPLLVEAIDVIKDIAATFDEDSVDAEDWALLVDYALLNSLGAFRIGLEAEPA